MTVASERPQPDSSVKTILIVHPDEGTRLELGSLLRGASEPVAMFESEAPSSALARFHSLAPAVVFLDLDAERELALDFATQARASGAHVIGLFNPLVMGDGADFYRRAARSGIGDFVPTPVAAAEVEAALAAFREPGGRGSGGRLATFCSHKGGSGTTTLAVNLALGLAASDLTDGEVALVDADLPFGMAAAYLGLAPTRSLSDLAAEIDSLTTLSPYLAEHPESGLRVLASPRDPRESAALSPEHLGRALVALKRRFDYLVVDGPSHLDLMAFAALDLSDDIFVVAEPIGPEVLASSRLVKLLESEGLGDRLRIVLNRDRGFRDALSEELVAEQLGRTVDFVIPYEEQATAAAHTGVPLLVSRPSSPFAEALGNLAETVVGGAAANRVQR